MQVDQEMLFEIILVRLETFIFVTFVVKHAARYGAAGLTDAVTGRQLSRHQGPPRRRM